MIPQAWPLFTVYVGEVQAVVCWRDGEPLLASLDREDPIGFPIAPRGKIVKLRFFTSEQAARDSLTEANVSLPRESHDIRG